MKNNRIQSTPDDFLLSNNHLRLLDRIFISHHQQCNLNILKQQIIDWMAMVLSEERENWSELKENLVQTLYSLDKKAEAVIRSMAPAFGGGRLMIIMALAILISKATWKMS